MSLQATVPASITLTGASVWHNWISIIRSSAKQSDIWDLIDPSLDHEPPLTAPTIPRRTGLPPGLDETQRNDQYTDQLLEFNVRQKDHREKKDALIRTLSYIQKSISPEYVTYILDKDTPWQALRSLQQAIEPHSSVRALEIDRQYKALCAGPPKGQNIKQWLSRWETVYAEAKATRHSDVETGLILNYFINSLKQTDPTWAATSLYDLQLRRSRNEQTPTFMEVLNLFRQISADNLLSSNSASSYAATLQGQPPAPTSSNPQNPKKEPPECACGMAHWYSDCYYLNESLRPNGWKPNAKMVKKVEEALKDSKVKANVDKARKRRADKQTLKTTAEPPTEPQDPKTFATVLHHSDPAAVVNINDYDIANSWILDSGSNIHVCNDPHRFKTTHPTTSDDYLVSGSTTYPITAYGTVDITVASPTGRTESVTLNQVALIPGFFTNLVSFSKAKAANIYWDTAKDTLYTDKNGKQDHFCQLKPHNGHWIIEYNDPPSATQIFASSAANSKAASQQKPFEASPNHLHQIMGHAAADAISKLPTAAEGLKLTSPCAQDAFKTCETCRLSKAHLIISRRSDNEVPSTRPLHRVAYDLIPMEQGYNGHAWISHFVCQNTYFHWLWTHRNKHEATNIVARMVNIAENQYQQRITFLRTDGEKSLGQAFENLLTEHGIQSERTAPYTPAQNGKSERSGGVIIQKARCMRIGANLPHHLWPETVSAAAYILNRTPTSRTGTTPFEALYHSKPTLSHMKIYGCRAYPLIYNIPKLQKLEPRAHIGYLVGYSSRNIYRIWIPSKKQVIRIRDVTFDENTHYELSDVDAGQLVQEQELLQAIQILQEIPEALLADNQDEQELEIPIPSNGNTPILPPKTTTDENQSYISPPPSDVVDSDESTSSSASSSGIPHRDSNWEYRPIGAPAPRFNDISADVNEDLILPSRTRDRRQAHAVAINSLHDLSGYHAAFATNLVPKDHLHRDQLPDEPKNWKQMLKHPHMHQFIQAANWEFDHLKSRGTFQLANRATIKSNILPLIWVFKYKFDNAGFLIKHKTRLCVRGDLQKTEQDTSAATLAIRVFRALMAITVTFELKAKQYDAVNAFVNSAMNEEVYVNYPEGIKPPTHAINPCFLLLRALYGLKQSPLLWLQEVTSTLLDLGLYPVPGVDCLFTNQWLILFFYVDDFVLLYRSQDEMKFVQFEAALLAKYEIRSLGDLHWFLGIRIIRSDDKLYLCQDSYIEKLVQRYHIPTTGPSPRTPLLMDQLVEYEDTATKAQIYAYQQRIGSLTFAATTTRPDIAFATAKLAQFLINPSPIHLTAANRLLAYLHHTKTLAIEFSKSKIDPIFLSSTDAAFADDQKTRKSSFGYLIQLYGGPIDWKASKQATVTTSSTEAELLALSETARQTLWWKRFFASINFDTQQQLVIHCDNKQTLGLMQTETPRLSTRLRHIDVHSCWLRQEIQEKRVTASWIPTADMPADGLTKALPIQQHQNFIKLLNMADISTLIV